MLYSILSPHLAKCTLEELSKLYDIKENFNSSKLIRAQASLSVIQSKWDLMDTKFHCVCLAGSEDHVESGWLYKRFEVSDLTNDALNQELKLIVLEIPYDSIEYIDDPKPEKQKKFKNYCSSVIEGILFDWAVQASKGELTEDIPISFVESIKVEEHRFANIDYAKYLSR